MFRLGFGLQPAVTECYFVIWFDTIIVGLTFATANCTVTIITIM